jgi:hypothetical protein
MNDLSKLLQLAERQRDERSRIKGRIDGIKKSIRAKGFKGEVHARNELKKLKLQLKKLKLDFDKRLAIFRKRYAEELNKIN